MINETHILIKELEELIGKLGHVLGEINEVKYNAVKSNIPKYRENDFSDDPPWESGIETKVFRIEDFKAPIK